MQSLNKIFVVGVGRSGTSLLQSMLNAHSNVAFMPETHFFRNYITSRKTKNNLEKEGFVRVLGHLKEDPNFSMIQSVLREIEETATDTEINLEDLQKNIWKLYLEQKQKKIIGEKDPRNIDYIPKIHKFFPDSKLIHLIRDPREVVLSRTKAAWSSHRPYWMHALIYKAQITRGIKKARTYFPENYYEMFYEDLVNQPEAELRKLCAFLEIDYDKNMLDFKHSANELIKESEVSWKKETLGPLLKKNTEKWKRELTNQQLFVIETICRKELKQWNYRFSDQHQRKSWKKFPQMVFLNILSIAFRLIYRFLT
jgi:hypothetical protein